MNSSTTLILDYILDRCIVPAVRVDSALDVKASLEGLVEGGIDVAEVAMSMSDGLPALCSAAENFGPSMLLGAGSVLDAETARLCLLAGARFLVTPSVSLGVIEVARRYSIPVFCGALTPTEVMAAWVAGADCVKVFPADALGGPSYIRSLLAPLPQVRLLPMGGVTLETAGAFLQAGSCAIGVGSDLVSSARLRAGGKNAIRERAQAYVEKIREFRSSMSSTAESTT